MFKKHSRITIDGKTISKVKRRYYWFTIVAANGEPLATSEMYTTAAMRDNGIEAVKKVVYDVLVKEKKHIHGYIKVPEAWLQPTDRTYTTQGTGWKVSEVKRKRTFAKDVLHLEDKHGKIKKR